VANTAVWLIDEYVNPVTCEEVYLCNVLICCEGDHMQVSNSDEEDEEDAEDEFHYEMELGDHR